MLFMNFEFNFQAEEPSAHAPQAARFGWRSAVGCIKAREAKAKAESSRLVEQMVKSNQASTERRPSQYFPSPSRCFQGASRFSRAAIYDRKIKPLNNPMSACCARCDTFDARDNVNLGSQAVFFSLPIHSIITSLFLSISIQIKFAPPLIAFFQLTSTPQRARRRDRRREREAKTEENKKNTTAGWTRRSEGE